MVLLLVVVWSVEHGATGKSGTLGLMWSGMGFCRYCDQLLTSNKKSEMDVRCGGKCDQMDMSGALAPMMIVHQLTFFLPLPEFSDCKEGKNACSA